MEVGFMTRKNGFNEIGWNWRSDAGYVGITKSILKSVLGVFMAILGSMNDAGCGGIVETILRSVLSIVLIIAIVTAILGSVLGATVVILRGASLFSVGDFHRNDVLFGVFHELRVSGWWS